ncbi:MAG TPA: ScpA family protein [Acidimicrobiales bacterium]|nr:ScpA family protein [Acidimicrobiales bacterium]
MAYEVQTEVFEGPFDLLLHLILREQVDLYEVRLSSIVDAYLEELDRLELLDLEVATEFLLIAATLLELKSKRLLPGDDSVHLDDELALWEERELLLVRLLECKTFKDAAQALQRLSAVAGRSYPRTAGLEDRFLELAPDLLAGVSATHVRDAFLRAVTPKPLPRVDLDHVAPIRASVTDAVEELLDELPRVGRMTFRELTGSLVDRLEIVVRFLAVLEMYKQGLVELDQFTSFGDITITWNGGEAEQAEEGGWMRAMATMDTYDG